MAKIRLSFVTNSSSSSFIIAKHKDCTYEEVLELVNKNKKEVKELIESFGDDMYFNNEDINSEIENENIDAAIELAVEELARELFKYSDGSSFKLDDWSLVSEEFSGEDGEFFPSAMYEFGHMLNSEHLKVG